MYVCMYVCTCLYVFACGSVCCRVASTVLILIWFTLLPLSLGYSISMGIILCILEHMIVKGLKLMQVVSICVELLCGLAGKTNVIGVCGHKRGPNYSVWGPSLCIQLLGFNYKC